MKKLMYLLAVLFVGGVAFAQSYDYDRLPHEQETPYMWFKHTTFEDQVVPLPNIATQGRMILFEKEVRIGGDYHNFLFEFYRTTDDPAKLHVSVTSLKPGQNVHDLKASRVRFFLEENGETVTSLDGNVKGYLPSYLIKMTWSDDKGDHQKYIGKVY